MTFDIHQKFAAYKKRTDAKLKAQAITVERQAKRIKELEGCGHRRTEIFSLENGYKYKCLSCGYMWVEENKPLNDAGKHNKAMFDNWQRHNEWRDEQGLKPAGCE